MTTRDEESFMARPPWNLGDQEAWLKPHDLDALLKHKTTVNLERDAGYYTRFVIEPLDRKLPIQSNIPTCMDLGCCRTECAGFFAELEYMEAKMVELLQQAARPLISSLRLFICFSGHEPNLLGTRLVTTWDLYYVIATVDFRSWDVVLLPLDHLPDDPDRGPNKSIYRFAYQPAGSDDEGAFDFRLVLPEMRMLRQKALTTSCEMVTISLVPEDSHEVLDLDIELIHAKVNASKWGGNRIWPKHEGDEAANKKRRKPHDTNLAKTLSIFRPTTVRKAHPKKEVDKCKKAVVVKKEDLLPPDDIEGELTEAEAMVAHEANEIDEELHGPVPEIDLHSIDDDKPAQPAPIT